MAKKQKEGHWRDRAIAAAETISDAFDVAKAYGAHVANWVLFFCLIATLIEMVSPAFEALAGLAIVGIQSISLDVAGFGLTAMAASAKRRGDEKSAKKANIMGWTLITVMAITVGLITVAAFKPEWASGIQIANQVLMFVRVIVTVFYGHIVHELRTEGAAHENRLKELETEVSTLKVQLSSKEQEVSTGQSEVSSLHVQLQVSTHKISDLQRQLDTSVQRVSNLENELSTGQVDTVELSRELNTLRVEAEGLRATLEAKVRLVTRDLQEQLDSKKHELESVQQALSSEQKSVSNLQKKVSSVHRPEVSSGQEKILQLDTRRRTGQEDIAEKIEALLEEKPGLSDRAIAAQLGCSPTTVGKHRTALEERKAKEA